MLQWSSGCKEAPLWFFSSSLENSCSTNSSSVCLYLNCGHCVGAVCLWELTPHIRHLKATLLGSLSLVAMACWLKPVVVWVRLVSVWCQDSQLAVLWHQWGIFLHTTVTHWIVSLHRATYSQQTRKMLLLKILRIPVDQQFKVTPIKKVILTTSAPLSALSCSHVIGWWGICINNQSLS